MAIAIDNSVFDKTYLIGGRRLKLHPEATAESVLSGNAVKFNATDTPLVEAVLVRGDRIPTEIRRLASEAVMASKKKASASFKDVILEAYSKDPTGHYTESARAFIESKFGGRFGIHGISADDNGITVHIARQPDDTLVESISQLANNVPVRYEVVAVDITESADAFVGSLSREMVLDENTASSIASEVAGMVAGRIIEMARQAGLSESEVTAMRFSGRMPAIAEGIVRSAILNR